MLGASLTCRLRPWSVVAVTLLAAGGLTACGSSNKASVSSVVAAALARPGPESILQAEPELHAAPRRTLDVLRALGVNRARVYVPWAAIAPDPRSSRRPARFQGAVPGAYPSANWSPYDRIVRGAHADGIGLDFTLSGPAPRWATGPGFPGGPYPGAWEPSASDFGAFVEAVGTRYSGRFRPAGTSTALPAVRFWAIWNEPNYGPDLAPQARDMSRLETSPRLYRGLLDAAWSALARSGHGRDTIVFGELAPRGITTGDNPGSFSGMVPLRFVRALYCVDSSLRPLQGPAASARGCPADRGGSHDFPGRHPALFRASGMSLHPYPQGNLAPDVVTPYEPDYADLAALPTVERTLDGLQSVYGSATRLPIYSTEFGYQTNPPEEIATAVTPAVAAAQLNHAEYLSWLDPRVRSYDQYQLVDPPGANRLGGFATGLRFAGGSPKATFAAFRLPIYLPLTRAERGRELEVWGCVRPAPDAARSTGRPQTVQVELATRAGARYRVITTVTVANPHGYFDVPVKFPSSGVARLRWAYPNGIAVFSRPVSITIR
ncbi:MAG: hypothetical protein ACR2JH_02215 [Solirubrobacteraceae bacterium]